MTTKGKTETVQLKPDALLFQNFAPALFSQSVRAYDRAKGGKQKVPVFVLPGAMVDRHPGGQGRGGAGRRRPGPEAPPVPVRSLAAWTSPSTPGPTTARSTWPTSRPSRPPTSGPGSRPSGRPRRRTRSISKPTHKVTVERGVGVPMRDGVKLSTDVYRPEGDGKYPVILIRTPYKKEVQELEGMYYARRGYAVAIQDVRGRFASPGEWEPFVHEPDDGYDAVEWLAARPWSTGKVGMVGGSYVGWVQWFAASRKPPHLATIIPNVSPPDPFYNFPYDHGVFFQWAAIWWADVLATDATADLSGAALEKTFDREYGQLLRPLPVIDAGQGGVRQGEPGLAEVDRPPDGRRLLGQDPLPRQAGRRQDPGLPPVRVVRRRRHRLEAQLPGDGQARPPAPEAGPRPVGAHRQGHPRRSAATTSARRPPPTCLGPTCGGSTSGSRGSRTGSTRSRWSACSS